MARYVVAQRRSHPIRNVLLFLLLLVVIYAICFGISLYRVNSELQEAQDAYQNVQQAVSSGQLSSAVGDVRTLCSATSSIGDEANTWVWVVGEYLPWLGEDVSVGRGLADVSDRLCNDALLPVVDQLEGILTGSGSISNTTSAISSASETVSSCSQELQSLGTSHFAQLNQAKDELSKTVSMVDGLIGSAS